jgi:hypothetical protein
MVAVPVLPEVEVFAEAVTFTEPLLFLNEASVAPTHGSDVVIPGFVQFCPPVAVTVTLTPPAALERDLDAGETA